MTLILGAANVLLALNSWLAAFLRQTLREHGEFVGERFV
jgi:hypothetical protein